MPQTFAERAFLTYGPAPTFDTMSDVEAAWLAAVIDGEGCISIGRLKDKFRVSVTMGNTSKAFVQRFYDVVRGQATFHDAPSNHRRNPKHKPCFMVSLNPRAIAPVLERIMPFLVIKHQQAKLAIQYRRLVENGLVNRTFNREALEQLHLECRALNRRGTAEVYE